MAPRARLSRMTAWDIRPARDTEPSIPALQPTQTRLIEAHATIREAPPERADFLHTVLCQVGMPRRKTEARTFERHSGHMSMLLEAGRLFDGRSFVDMPLPYGVIPRLVMVHVSSQAVRTRCRSVEIGESMRQFLASLGMSTSGGERGSYHALRRQMNALAACRLSIGMQEAGRVVTVDAKPIKRFEAWIQADGLQRSLWPGVIELSEDFFATLTEHAVPLDPRALAALRHSALALDVYTWLAHRLCRVRTPTGTRLSWENLRGQFGQEYRSSRDFKKEFRQALRQVRLVYPDARVAEVIGGLLLQPSHPPMARLTVAMPRLHD